MRKTFALTITAALLAALAAVPASASAKVAIRVGIGDQQISTFDQSGWPLADIPNGEVLITSLTAQDLQRAATRYLRSDNYVRVSLYTENYPAAENKE